MLQLSVFILTMTVVVALLQVSLLFLQVLTV